ncbi:CHASE4 domain-containing protein [Chloroflexota bacterium]
MTLRKKALLIIGVAVACLVGFVYIASRFVLLEDLEEIEKLETHKNVERTLSTFYYSISDLEARTTDWSSWDNTYAFIETGDPEYIQSNLIMEAFLNLRLNVMLFINSSGQTVFGKAVDLVNEEEIPIPPGFRKYLADNSPLLEQPGTEGSKSGIILLEGGPMLIVSRPILTSDDEGPARGTVIFGRYLDSREMERLTQLTLLPVDIRSIRDLNTYPDFNKALPPLLAGTPVFVQPLNTRHIAGYTLIKDIYGNPALVMRVDTLRDIYQQGEVSVAYYILVVLSLGLLGAGVVFLILQKQVFSRFTRLIKGITGITETSDLSTRLQITGADELTTVAQTVNGMLAALEESGGIIRQQYEREKELRLEVENEMNRRAEFTRALVHELKTPITPVLAASELLQEEVKEERTRNLSQSIHRGALNLNKRIDELLDLARCEIGALTLNRVTIDPVSTIEEIVTGTMPLASEKGQNLTSELPPSLPAVQVDFDRFTQVIQNLLNNALKFTPEGSTICVRGKVDGANLVIEIEDTGLGLSKEEQERLFDPYHRLPGDRERFSGLGLGLALSKKFVELHGGQIWVKSKKGAGSTFGFSIPLESDNRTKEEVKQRSNNESSDC